MSVPEDVARADTGTTRIALGMWLFIASEVMLFGGLFSAYALLRAGATNWPAGQLSPMSAGLSTLGLLLAAGAVYATWLESRAPTPRVGRAQLIVAIVFGLSFLGRVIAEYANQLSSGHTPSSSTFWALYYLLTAVHAVHVIAAVAVTIYFVGPGWIMGEAFSRRMRALSLYWNFVVVVWLCLIIAFYVT